MLIQEDIKRAAIDTNVILNATFISGGTAYKALHILSMSGTECFTTPSVLNEVSKTLKSISDRNQITTFDPYSNVLKTLKSLNIKILNNINKAFPRINRINKSDKHVARAAYHYDAHILTSDTEFYVQCIDAGLKAKFPWTLSRDHGVDHSHPCQWDTIRVYTPHPERGSIFARLEINGDRKTSNSRHYVFDISGLFRCFYNGQTKKWVFAVDQWNESFEIEDSSTPGQICIYVGYSKNKHGYKVEMYLSVTILLA